MTRNGKIARLPQEVREKLNRRLQNGEPGKGLVEWLNGLKEVQAVLAGQFGGLAVTEQNLSEWKQGGYRDWQRQELAARLGSQGEGLAGALVEMDAGGRLAGMLAAEFMDLTDRLLQEAEEPGQRWQRLRGMLQELSQLRRDNHGAVRALIRREEWGRELKRQKAGEREAARRARKDRICAPLWAAMRMQPMTEAFGGGETGRKLAAFLQEVENDLPEGTLQSAAPCAEPPLESTREETEIGNGVPDDQPNPTESK